LTSGLWGWLLCVKVIAVVGILMIAALNRLRYLQHVRRGDPDALTVFRRLLGIEAWLMIGVMVIAAALGHTMPATVA
ncbi:MAG: CopD family protein, partial [Burkholderiales bacterium]|nr:CopD family protein [Burkholderiales bacterium]